MRMRGDHRRPRRTDDLPYLCAPIPSTCRRVRCAPGLRRSKSKVPASGTDQLTRAFGDAAALIRDLTFVAISAPQPCARVRARLAALRDRPPSQLPEGVAAK